MKRRYAAKRRSVRRKPSRQRARPTRSFATKVRKVVSTIAETKRQTNNATEVAVTTQPTGNLPFIIENFNNVSQGTNSAQRVGIEIMGKGLRFNGLFQSNSPANVYLRILVLEIPQADLDYTTSLFTPLFYNGGPVVLAGTIQDIFRKVNPKYKTRYDKIVHMGWSGSDWPSQPWQFYIPYKRRIKYNINVAIPLTPRPVIFMWARRADNDEPVSPGDVIEMSYETQFTYTDV